MKINFHILRSFAFAAAVPAAPTDALERNFRAPPDLARPRVCRCFPDGNRDRVEMVADLHAMKNAGIGIVQFLELDPGTGQTTGPAPQAGHGFACNKFDGESYRRQWDNYQKKLSHRRPTSHPQGGAHGFLPASPLRPAGLSGPVLIMTSGS